MRVEKNILVSASVAAVIAIGLAALPGGAKPDVGGAASEASVETVRTSIVEAERQWAAAVATGDTAIVDRILAEDFLGTDFEGKTYDKAGVKAMMGAMPEVFASNRLGTIKVRFFGNTAVVQGDETWQRKADQKRGRFMFTDTWVLRDGTWQVVATALIAPPEGETASEG